MRLRNEQGQFATEAEIKSAIRKKFPKTRRGAARARKYLEQRTNGLDAAATIKTPMDFSLRRILRGQAQFRWLGPQLAAITPQYIEATLTGAMAGAHVQQWSLFDLMLKTWPELLACYTELTQGVLRKKLIFEAYCEEDEKPTPSADERMKVVSTALNRMEPDPTRDDQALEGTLKDILDGWFRGMAVSEIVWQTIDDPQVGTIAAPKSTYSVDTTNYAFSNEGVLGLRSDKSKNAMGIWPYSTTSVQPIPSDLVPFPPNKFLIALHKVSAGGVVAGALLRPLAWWWCAANFSSDWLLNLAQVFGLPFRWANYDTNAPQATIDAICTMLQNMGSAGWAAFPVGTTLEMINASGQQGSDHSPQGELLDRADRYARLLILGQTMTGTHGTTGKGGGQAFGEVEADVKADRIDAAGKFACEVINQQFVKFILTLNYGDTDEAPKCRFLEDEVAGLQEAQRDKMLADAGLEIGVDHLRKKYDIPEPGEGEDTIGGEQPMPDFGGGFGNFDQQPNDQQDNQDAAQAGDLPGHEFHGNQYTKVPFQDALGSGDKPGHAFHGNQYLKLGDYVETPHGRGMVVANQYNTALVSVKGTIRRYPMSQLRKIPYDHSRFPSLTRSAEDERRHALNLQLKQLGEISDDAVFAQELKKLAGITVEDPPPQPQPAPPPQVINLTVEPPAKKSFTIKRADGSVIEGEIKPSEHVEVAT